MSAAVANYVFGVPLTAKVREWLDANGHAEDDMAFLTLYSGNAITAPGYLGMSLGCLLECPEPVPVKANDKMVGDFSIQPTPDMVTQVDLLISTLPDELQALLEPVGVYIIWSTT